LGGLLEYLPLLLVTLWWLVVVAHQALELVAGVLVVY
jgi:hypothetical protein